VFLGIDHSESLEHVVDIDLLIDTRAASDGQRRRCGPFCGSITFADIAYVSSHEQLAWRP
jgi:hypothetical protein